MSHEIEIGSSVDILVRRGTLVGPMGVVLCFAFHGPLDGERYWTVRLNDGHVDHLPESQLQLHGGF